MTSRTDLSVLLQRGAQIREQAKLAKQARRDAKGAPTLEAEQLNALARRIESELHWLDVGVVHQFERQHCDQCNATSTTLLGTFIKQTHRKDSTAVRKLRASRNLPALPIERDVWDTHVMQCFNCMESEQGTTIEMSNGE